MDAIDKLDEDDDLVDEIEKSWKPPTRTHARDMFMKVPITTLRSSHQGWVMAAINPISLTMRIIISANLLRTLGYSLMNK